MMKVKHGKTNFKALESFLKVVEENDGYAKFTAKGYMDLVIEKTWLTDEDGNPIYSICHYGEMNGDAMRDPEMEICVDWKEGTILPLSYRNDYMGFTMEYFEYRNGKPCGYYHPRWLHDGDNFLWTWGKNLKDQGFNPDHHKQMKSEIVDWEI